MTSDRAACTGFLGTGKYAEERDGQQWHHLDGQQLLAGNVFVLSGLARLAALGIAAVLSPPRAAPGV